MKNYVYDIKKLPEFLTVTDVCRALRCSESKVRKSINEGKLKVFREGKLLRIQKQAFFEYVERYGGAVS